VSEKPDPIPWDLQEIDVEEGEDWPHHLSIVDAEGEEVATIVHRPGPPVPDMKYERGWRIIRAVNTHDKLLTALKNLRPLFECGAAEEYAEEIEAAEAAITEAEGEVVQG